MSMAPHCRITETSGHGDDSLWGLPRRGPVAESPGSEVFRSAACIVTAGAAPLSHNGFKVDLTKHSVVRALPLAAGRR